MTTDSPGTASPRRVFAFIALHGQNALLVAILGFVLLCGYAGAFQHMHDWTMEAVPRSQQWQGWANAIISELMPAAAFLIILKRQELGRSIRAPRILLILASGLSLCAQLSATDFRFRGDTQLLACLPLLAVMILGEMILSDWSQGRKIAERRSAAAEQAAELERRNAELVAEQAAERAAEQARRQAEHEAERAERAAALAAELAERQRASEAAERLRLAELEQAALTRRDQLAADERRAEREARLAIEREAAMAEAAGRAQAERLRAEADAAARRVEAEASAAREAAETVRLETETKIREQAFSRLNGRHRAVGEGSGPAPRQAAATDLDEARRSRRSREETETLVDAVLSTMPADATRADAVKAVSAELSVTDRQARKFVPEDWTAASSAAGSGNRAA